MKSVRNHYEILGVAETATIDELKTRFFDLARQFHPDRAKNKALASRLFAQINVAYHTLLDPDKRAIYDLGLRKPERGVVVACAKPPAAAAPVEPGGAPQPSLPVALSTATDLFMRRDFEAASRSCRSLLEAHPGSIEGHRLMADIFIKQRHHGDAINHLQRAIELGDTSWIIKEKMRRLVTLQSAPAASQRQAAANPHLAAKQLIKDAAKR